MLLFLVITATDILFVPGIVAQTVRQSAWLVFISSSLTGLTALWIISKLGQRFPRLTLPQYSEIILGKISGKIISAAYVLFFLTVNILVNREFSEFLTNSLSIGTSMLILNTAIVLVSGYGAFKGIEVIIRMAQFVLPLFVFSFLFLFTLAVPNVDLEKLLPLFEGGFQPIFSGSIVPASFYGEIVVLVMLLPIVNHPQEVRRKALYTLLAITGFSALGTLIMLTVIGPDLMGHLLFPLWYLARAIEFKSYIQRIEGLVFPLWITGVVVKSTVFYYLACLATAQVLGLKTHKTVVCVFAPVQIMAATFLFGNMFQLYDVLNKYWPPLGLVFEVVLPLLLLMIAALRKKRQGVMAP